MILSMFASFLTYSARLPQFLYFRYRNSMKTFNFHPENDQHHVQTTQYVSHFYRRCKSSLFIKIKMNVEFFEQSLFRTVIYKEYKKMFKLLL